MKGNVMKKMLGVVILLLPLAAMASEGVRLDNAPIDPNNHASLQRGAKAFVNYCLNCHSASSMRYNRLRDIGLSDAQIKESLLFAAEKVGEPMKVAMVRKDAKKWFGVNPPDLSVQARAYGNGADWLYTYLRGFYRDETSPTGWNNTVFERVGMPHVLWELQGQQVLKVEEKTDAQGLKTEARTLVLDKPGIMSPAEYDGMVADLVNYLVYMAEPAKVQRKQWGLIVLLFFGLMLIPAYYLKKEFWKDVH